MSAPQRHDYQHDRWSAKQELKALDGRTPNIARALYAMEPVVEVCGRKLGYRHTRTLVLLAMDAYLVEEQDSWRDIPEDVADSLVAYFEDRIGKEGR